MDDIEKLKQAGARQFRHNNDNSDDLSSPANGFVVAYDKGVIDAGLKELQQQIKELEALLTRVLDETCREYEQQIKKLEDQQGALYRSLESAQSERLEAVKKLNALEPYIDWVAYYKSLENR